MRLEPDLGRGRIRVEGRPGAIPNTATKGEAMTTLIIGILIGVLITRVYQDAVRRLRRRLRKARTVGRIRGGRRVL